MPLLIIDDLFPYNASGFRKTEIEYLLENFKDSRVISTLESLAWLTHDTSRIKVQTEYASENPPLAQRTIYVTGDELEEQTKKNLYSADGIPTKSLLYCLFLNNAFRIANFSEKNQTPFVFELYPGGGFLLGDSESDEKLLKVLSSPMLEGVIVTMPVTRKYLLKFCKRNRIPRPKIIYVYGGVLKPNSTSDEKGAFLTATSTKEPLRVLFVAHKYSQWGIDKGLDVFVESCTNLINQGYSIDPVIAGPWNELDIEDEACRKNFSFIGLIPNNELPKLFRSVSVSVFPTRASILDPGSFDGFPVGAAVEAAIHGNAIITTNPLKMKSPFRRSKDYELIEPEAKSLTHSLKRLVSRPKKLKSLRTNAFKSFRKVFDLDSQMSPRVQFLDSLLLSSKDRI